MQAINPVITFHDKKGNALVRQKEFQNGCPFNASPNMGCLLGCRYCYTQGSPFKFHTEFGREVKVKTWFPEKVSAELQKYSSLPQHLKRVQINEACEYYIPEVMAKMDEELNRDIMAEILDAFKRQWDSGNKWMLHILTKSPYIVRHLDLLAGMRQMVQVEMTLICLDENKRRSVEVNAAPISERLEAMRQLSRAGVFVRVMAMPFFGNREDAAELKERVFEMGAKAFKHKELNYFDWDDLVRGEAIRRKGRDDTIYRELLEKSGEPYLQDGRQPTIALLMPNEEWAKREWQNNLEEQEVPVINFGYSDLNDVDWGYVV